jgi:hypothetical protein
VAKRVRKNRSVRMTNLEWGEVITAASHETRRRGETVEAGTLARELSVRGARRINARASLLAGGNSRQDAA